MYVIHAGTVTSGFQFASGGAVGRGTDPSPFGAGTLALQHPHFKARGLDLAAEIPSLVWGTINVELEREVSLARADRTIPDIDWTSDGVPTRIPPETFSFVRCCFAFDDRYFPGLIYYPHPETKPNTNRHRYDVLEVLTCRVDGLTMGSSAAIMCRADAFRTHG
ncbi:MAG TPA: hypothetical protein VF603_02025 [Allosphingosinicella sp.]|jgi:hypothetical protein